MGEIHDLTAGSRGRPSGSGPRSGAPGASHTAGAAGARADRPGAIDVIAEVLRSVRLTGSMLFLVDASAPWMSRAPAANAFAAAVLPRAQHLISYHVVTDGSCWCGIEGARAQPLVAGNILVIPHGDAYFLADSPDSKPSYGDDDAVSFFRRMAAGELPSTVNEGGDGSRRTQFICGFLGCDTHPFNPILAALPKVLVVRPPKHGDDPMAHLIDFAIGALRERHSGSQEVLLRLSELMFVEVVRRHLATVPETQSGWLAGLQDRVVSKALARLHADPSRAWTLDALADEVAASRSVLAERFSRIVGQPPMRYLSAWRMQLATRLLGEPGSHVETVATAVGYQSSAAFSRAFKKTVGVAPALWQRQAAQQ